MMHVVDSNGEGLAIKVTHSVIILLRPGVLQGITVFFLLVKCSCRLIAFHLELSTSM